MMKPEASGYVQDSLSPSEIHTECPVLTIPFTFLLAVLNPEGALRISLRLSACEGDPFSSQSAGKPKTHQVLCRWLRHYVSIF